MTIPIIKQVPPSLIGGKTLFAGSSGKFYNAAGKELKPQIARGLTNPRNHGGRYPRMTNFKARPCHLLIYETFVGPRTPGMQIDHLNGNVFDWSRDNLQEVTPAENIRRAKILRAMRRGGVDPATFSRARLLAIFNGFEVVPPEEQIRRELDNPISFHLLND